MLPYLVLHITMSADGRIDWGSWNLRLYYELASRWEIDAVLAGSNTILAAEIPDEIPEDWQADTEPNPARQRLVVVDSRGRLRNWPVLKKQPYWRDPMALCSASTDPQYLHFLSEHGIDYIQTGGERVDLREALQELKSSYGVNFVRVDSGGILNGVLLRAGLVDEVSLLISPELVGGTSPRSIFVAPDLSSADATVKLKMKALERFDNDYLWLQYEASK